MFNGFCNAFAYKAGIQLEKEIVQVRIYLSDFNKWDIFSRKTIFGIYAKMNKLKLYKL